MPPRTVKTKTTTIPIVEPVVAPVKEEVIDKKVKKEVKKEPVVVEEVDNTVDAVVEEKQLGDTLINELTDKITSVQHEMKSIQQTLKLITKEYEKQKKIIAKVQRKRDNAKKSPSGFAKPCKISIELCKFVGIPEGSERSRTDITRYINAYVKEKNLNNPENRREFFPDEKLRAILNVTDKEKVTYFILQRLIAHHFPLSINKQNALAALAAAEAAAAAALVTK
jgi:chromatin remodeling complex protein RSC6|tara:strand:- start:853 stop:1524 length:672 start_codon:yes stop_codon:yes gene_type:complete